MRLVTTHVFCSMLTKPISVFLDATDSRFQMRPGPDRRGRPNMPWVQWIQGQMDPGHKWIGKPGPGQSGPAAHMEGSENKDMAMCAGTCGEGDSVVHVQTMRRGLKRLLVRIKKTTMGN